MLDCDFTMCGWDATQGYYDCSTQGGSDPSGTHPKDCP